MLLGLSEALTHPSWQRTYPRNTVSHLQFPRTSPLKPRLLPTTPSLRSWRDRITSRAWRRLKEGKVDSVPITSSLVEPFECRKSTLQLIQKITVEFVKHVSKTKNLPQSVVEKAGGKIFTFGSYRLGVYGPGQSFKSELTWSWADNKKVLI